MDSSIKWAAELAHVREVSLRGTADLAFWVDWLPSQALHPAASEDGNAQLKIIAADLAFMGVRFQELSFSVLVCGPKQASRGDAAYLVQAFNSSRVFAWCERVFFAAPYDYGDVGVSASFPASMQLVKNGEVLFRAEIGAEGCGQKRPHSRREENSWEGPIFLPKRRRQADHESRFFFARIAGDTQIYPFLPAQDTLMIKPTPANEILQALLDSHFIVKEWLIREDATHAKSKTYTQKP
jgi:hypothetical protein